MWERYDVEEMAETYSSVEGGVTVAFANEVLVSNASMTNALVYSGRSSGQRTMDCVLMCIISHSVS